ncbi:MAG: VOC family protein [Chloroflexota bacterium]
MPAQPRMTMTGTVLSAPDARELAAFYRRLLGWSVTQDEPGWVKLEPPRGGPGLSFQSETVYTRPTWPSTPGQQEMMLHLDIEVDDLAAASAHTEAAGATLAESQPQADVRVYLDPAGHPFCLWVRTG